MAALLFTGALSSTANGLLLLYLNSLTGYCLFTALGWVVLYLMTFG